jgi:hypothetical protein
VTHKYETTVGEYLRDAGDWQATPKFRRQLGDDVAEALADDTAMTVLEVVERAKWLVESEVERVK